jgi:DNA-directed RNA polymerase subunit beta'
MSTAANKNSSNNADASEGTSYERINDYGPVRISLASPHDIRSWSFGEVKKPETINYPLLPAPDGRPVLRADLRPVERTGRAPAASTGMKYKGNDLRPLRREGHAQPRPPQAYGPTSSWPRRFVHIWFFKGHPSRLGSLLVMKDHVPLERIIYFQDYVGVRRRRYPAEGSASS